MIHVDNVFIHGLQSYTSLRLLHVIGCSIGNVLIHDSYQRCSLCATYTFIYSNTFPCSYLLVGNAARQGLDLVLEQLLGALPDGGGGAVLEGHQAGQQGVAKGLGRLARQGRGQVVDGDDGQRRPVALDVDGDGGLVEGGVDVVDGDGVVGVGGVAGDIADDAQLAGGALEAGAVDKGRDGLGQVDAVDENVRLDNLRVRAVARLGLGQVPLLDLAAADLFEQVDGAGAAAAEGAQDQAGGLAAGDLFTGGDVLLELGDQVALGVVVAAAVGEGLDAGQGLAVGVCELPSPGLAALALWRNRGIKGRGCMLTLMASAAPAKPAW